MRTSLSLLVLAAALTVQAADLPVQRFPVRGLCISAPRQARVDAFVEFIHRELAPRAVNTLILRVDFNYEFESHPELRDNGALSKADVKKIVDACQQHQIQVLPQINLLGHQSWASQVGNLLRVYPEFDETPWVKMPEKYAWPNPDKLYCKSYCPLHPKVHEVVFALVDEICQAFSASGFHAGMDEVFYIGEDKCPRCAGKDKAELFAGEVTAIRDHLQKSNVKLWMWGDRLLDGATTGLGEWEASLNGTHRAIDLIPKDVVICDWHYERADLTAAYFALKGLQVVTCPWKNQSSAVQQVRDVVRFREHSTPQVRDRVLGIMQTVWSGAEGFVANMERLKNRAPGGTNPPGEAACFVRTFAEIAALNGASATPAVKSTVKRALVLAEAGGHHVLFSKAARVWLREFALEQPFQFDFVENTKNITAAALADYQLIVQLDYPPYGWTPEAASAFQEYIEKGKGGWVGFHHATLLGEFDGYKMWPWFSDFMGGIRYQNYLASFVSATVQVEDGTHPCLRGVAPSFPVQDEEWYTYDRSPRGNVRVLASVDEKSYRPASSITMGDHPVVWTNEKVAARNIYIFMGHRPEHFQNPDFVRLFQNSVLWAAGVDRL